LVGWRCENCNYLHISTSISERIPSRCPVCGSKRLELYEEDIPHPNPSEYIRRLSSLKRLRVDESEEERRKLREEGIHVLLEDESRGELKEYLTKEEAAKYLKMVKEYDAALAVLGGAVVVVEKSSKIRGFVGVSATKLQELIEAAGR
jgi:predicted  nucleic acid-binding Zn-ribbon protein